YDATLRRRRRPSASRYRPEIPVNASRAAGPLCTRTNGVGPPSTRSRGGNERAAPDPFADQDGCPGHRPMPGPAGPGPNQTGGEEGPVLEMGEEHRLERERCVAADLGRHRDEELPRLGGDADPTGHRPHIPPAADVI